MMKKFMALVFIMLLAVPALAEEITTRYFTVNVPDDWKAVMPPSENQGMSTAIFVKASGALSVTLFAGPNSGADAKSIASMFAEQFKSEKPPVEKNGQYTFTFMQQNVSAQVWVATEGDAFLVTSIAGSPRKEGLEFVKKNVKSANYAGMLPK
ncbi:hypothetical protein [Desulfovibrio sp. ZJ369]|uniref:hypothetical protein n=1 Tax=Desulfovibrio sp. ZJ369 TaxID=2709793 RepID=UPI0013EC3678|nr:hypothetical protein [Desulfovibrio sp. ZJ369]